MGEQSWIYYDNESFIDTEPHKVRKSQFNGRRSVFAYFQVIKIEIIVNKETEYYCVEKSAGLRWIRVDELGSKMTKDKANEMCDELKEKDTMGHYRVVKEKRP